MKRWSRGSIFMLLGVLMILASAGFVGIHVVEERQAGQEAGRVSRILKEQIADARAGVDTGAPGVAEEAGDAGDASQEEQGDTSGLLLSGDYIGLLSIPDLGLELPVARQWSYPALRKTPCRYSGSVEEENLVVLAHNYERHFGGLKDLKPGAEITFTRLDGTETGYQAVDVRTLGPEQGEEMLEGDWQILLFTCTYGGEKRVAVRCRKLEVLHTQE